MVDCVFTDGNASAINVFASLNVSNCVFDNMFFVAEYYQAYSTNISYFQNNLVTNITYNCFAINGGKGNNPPFVIQNNTFYLPGHGNNGIQITPGDNVYIISNQFLCGDYANVFTIGSAGAQGTFENSNIVIAANTIVNPFNFVELGGDNSGYNPTNNYAIEDVAVYGNILKQPNHVVMFLQTYGWTTNIHFFSNDCSSFMGNGSTPVKIISGLYGSPFALIDTNNLYYITIQDLTGITNYISYANGSRFEVIAQFVPGTVYALTDTNSSQIPPGAQILVVNNITTNFTYQTTSFPLYLNSALTSGPVNVASGQTLTAVWTNGFWMVYSSQPVILSPPVNFHVIGQTNGP